MKKAITIFLLFIMLFNMVGYRFVFLYLENKAIAQLDKKIDNHIYDEASLIEFKAALNMPYYTDRPYETAYGQTEINGEIYQYVKRKITNNILYLLCLPNKEKESLNITKNNVAINNFDTDNNNSSNKNEQHGKAVYKISEYIENEIIEANFEINFIENKKLISKNIFNFNLCFINTPEQPPEIFI